MKLKIGTLLVASTLLDLTPATALHAQFRGLEAHRTSASEFLRMRNCHATDTDHRDPIYKITVTLGHLTEEFHSIESMMEFPSRLLFVPPPLPGCGCCGEAPCAREPTFFGSNEETP